MHTTGLAGIVDRARNIADLASDPNPQPVGPQLDVLWRELAATPAAAIEAAADDIVTAMQLLGDRGVRIVDWMVDHSDGRGAAHFTVWSAIARRCTDQTAVAA